MANQPAGDPGRANPPFGRLVVQALHRLGVSHFVLSPGSRSTPLALAVAELPPEHSSVMLDERSAAYYALGRIKASRAPVALVCTSGTAAANYLPAVVEARESGLPLVVLTADRPPELRHCHAGQTIDQLKLYGNYPVFQAELPVPEAEGMLLRQVRELCRRALEAALGGVRGPVHLNCPFREPFTNADDADADPIEAVLREGLHPVAAVQADPGQMADLPERTLILAGPRPMLDVDGELQALLDLSWHYGFPILADGANPLRYHAAESTHVIIHYDRIVRDDAAWRALRPDAVVMWGEPPTSKTLRQRLAALDVRGYLVGEGKAGINPLFGRIEWAGTSAAAFIERCRGHKGAYGQLWAGHDRAAETALLAELAAPHPLFEGDVHRLLGCVLPEDAPVVFASSLAIRDAEWFMPHRREPLFPFSQRGANGIDGTVSLARGVADGMGRPAWLVTGDLALLHDSNGLLGAARQRHGLFIVLLDNGGGGIFQFLPVAGREAAFERFFATPQQVDFAALARAHGAAFVDCAGLDALERAIIAWDGTGVSVARVAIDRKQSRELHRRMVGGGKK